MSNGHAVGGGYVYGASTGKFEPRAWAAEWAEYEARNAASNRQYEIDSRNVDHRYGVGVECSSEPDQG